MNYDSAFYYDLTSSMKLFSEFFASYHDIFSLCNEKVIVTLGPFDCLTL